MGYPGQRMVPSVLDHGADVAPHADIDSARRIPVS
jgi:hypothetical protein